MLFPTAYLFFLECSFKGRHTTTYRYVGKVEIVYVCVIDEMRCESHCGGIGMSTCYSDEIIYHL